MEAKELRLGNLFIEENSKKIIEVIGLEKNRVIFSEMFLEKWQAKPILLTEEWLLKLGLANKILCLDKETDFHLDKLQVGYNVEIYQEREYSNSEKIVLKKIEYVHQLQNLYFALTNNELTIK